MKKTQLTIAIAALLFLAQACFLLPKPKPRPYAPVPQIFKDYTVFQEGTYWIFQNDSFPSALDSSYVIKSSCSDEVSSAKWAYDFEICYLDLVYLNERWSQAAGAIMYSHEDDNYIYVNHEFREVDQTGDCFHLFLDSASMDTMRAGSEFTYITGRYDTLELNGNTYHDVVRVTHEMNIYGNPNRELYYARNVGIIRRVLWDGNSWSLRRSHIVQ